MIEEDAHRDYRADDEGVVVLEDGVVCTLEADVEFGRSVGLHVLEGLTCEGEPSARPRSVLKGEAGWEQGNTRRNGGRTKHLGRHDKRKRGHACWCHTSE